MAQLTLPESVVASRQMWSRLAPSQRGVLALAVLAAIGAVLAVVLLGTRPASQTLFSGLSPEDSARVQARLGGLSIPFEVTEAGATVKVGADRIDAARLALASEGMPESGTLGFEIFDRTQLGVTDFTENVNLRRALEGELARTVRGLTEVQAARVHVVMPRERPFARDAREAKASVVLRLRPGRKLESANVQAIQHLVSAAVDGLKPESVVVVDDQGSLLSRGAGAGTAAGLSGEELDEKRRLERELQDNVLGILEPLVGAGRVFARVSAELDFSLAEETAEIFDPERKAIVSEQRAEERFAGGAAAASGVPGVASNVVAAGASPAAPALPEPPAKLSETRNYEVSKTVRRTTMPRGRLKRLSVAVVLEAQPAAVGPAAPAPAAPIAAAPMAAVPPAAASPAVADPAGPAAAASAPPEARLPEAARLHSLVAAAVGLDPGRGDQLEVEVLPFEPAAATGLADPALAAPGLAEQAREWLAAYGRPAGIALALCLGYLLFLRPLKREAMAALRAAAAPRAALPAQAVAGAAGGVASAAESLADRGEDRVSIGSQALPNEVRQAVARAVSSDPAATARFIRGWLDREPQ